MGVQKHPCTQKKVHNNIWRWNSKESSVTRQADFRAVKQIMLTLDVCSEDHSGVACDEWVVYMASGSFPGERLSWKMILAIMVGKCGRTQIYLLLPCLHEEW